MEIDVKPVGDYIVLATGHKKETTEAGLHIPSVAQEPPSVGRVIAVGREVASIQVGDRVIYGKHAGKKLRLDDSEYLAMKEGEVICVVGEEVVVK